MKTVPAREWERKMLCCHLLRLWSEGFTQGISIIALLRLRQLLLLRLWPRLPPPPPSLLLLLLLLLLRSGHSECRDMCIMFLRGGHSAVISCFCTVVRGLFSLFIILKISESG